MLDGPLIQSDTQTVFYLGKGIASLSVRLYQTAIIHLQGTELCVHSREIIPMEEFANKRALVLAVQRLSITRVRRLTPKDPAAWYANIADQLRTDSLSDLSETLVKLCLHRPCQGSESIHYRFEHEAARLLNETFQYMSRKVSSYTLPPGFVKMFPYRFCEQASR